MEKITQQRAINSLSYFKRHQKSYINKAVQGLNSPQVSRVDQDKFKIQSKGEDMNKSIQTPNFDEDFRFSSDDSLRSDSSQRITSPQIEKILKNYSNNPNSRIGIRGKVQVKSILNKKSTGGKNYEGESITPSPHVRGNLSEKKKNLSIQLLNFGIYKKSKPRFKDMIYSNADETTVLSKQIEHYEKIIRNQSKKVTKLNSPVPRSESRSISISPTNSRLKQGNYQFENFWNLKDSQFADPKHLHEMEGFKNLWICNIESKIINPPVGFSKVMKIPSSIINRYKYSK